MGMKSIGPFLARKYEPGKEIYDEIIAVLASGAIGYSTVALHLHTESSGTIPRSPEENLVGRSQIRQFLRLCTENLSRRSLSWPKPPALLQARFTVT
jgi:hypothetical protein